MVTIRFLFDALYFSNFRGNLERVIFSQGEIVDVQFIDAESFVYNGLVINHVSANNYAILL